jgi:hypothetical protein
MTLVASPRFELKGAEISPGRMFDITETSEAHRDFTICVAEITRYFHIRQNLCMLKAVVQNYRCRIAVTMHIVLYIFRAMNIYG